MPTLTRRRYPERPDCWHVFYGDVHVGTIGIRSGVAFDKDQWGWSCGFYPGCDPGQHTNGSSKHGIHSIGIGKQERPEGRDDGQAHGDGPEKR